MRAYDGCGMCGVLPGAHGKQHSPSPHYYVVPQRVSSSAVKTETRMEKNGCKWCGGLPGTHGRKNAPGIGEHYYTSPQAASYRLVEA